jgi:hypothetical protein
MVPVFRDFQSFRPSLRSCVIFYNMLLPVYKLFDISSVTMLENHTSSGLSCCSVDVLASNLHISRQCNVLPPQPDVVLPCTVSKLNFISVHRRLSCRFTAQSPSFMFLTCGGQIGVANSSVSTVTIITKTLHIHSLIISVNSINITIINNFTCNTLKMQHVSISPRSSPGSSLHK